ncbi:four helix bundle protein [Mucilaginibacter sp. KACC 22063]|uniref:four helix bundle protein n=1 Tax=Mucilaginibacter sp. KACC 22063 TaxID=3025666 RepID=UPI002366F91A|nr:four helix bundle protein [Mucilaginibacter sp. KACC 22063]WDF55335.1 four helix bundle protein [Mucilaginibacter sp. KACC 22063]
MIFTNLEVWKEARVLVKLVYTNISTFPREEMFGLQSQIKRSVISIPSNIAEGCGRNSVKDSMQFFYIARGSAFELEAQLYLSNDLGFVTEDQLNIMLKQLELVRKILAGFINFYKTQLPA